MRLNEILPNPKTRYSAEWVELVNTGAAAVGVGGWMLDDGDAGAAPYTIPSGTTIAAHGLFVVTLPRTLFNNAGDEVRLLRPDGSVADQFQYADSAADLSFCRHSSGWAAGSPPSPNAPNRCEPNMSLPTATSHAQAAAGQPLATAGPQRTDSAEEAAASPSPTPHLPAWSAADVAGATPYALPTPGLLYRGLLDSSPTAHPTIPPAPSRTPRSAALNRPVQGNTFPPLGRAAGIGCIMLSATVAGYTRLRSRGAAPGATAPLSPGAEAGAPPGDEDG